MIKCNIGDYILEKNIITKSIYIGEVISKISNEIEFRLIYTSNIFFSNYKNDIVTTLPNKYSYLYKLSEEEVFLELL